MRSCLLGLTCFLVPSTAITAPEVHHEAHEVVLRPILSVQRAWVGVTNLTDEARALCIEECTYSIDAADGSRVVGGMGGSTHGTLCGVAENWHLVLPGQTYYFTEDLRSPDAGYGEKFRVRLLVRSAPEDGPLSAVRARSFRAEVQLHE